MALDKLQVTSVNLRGNGLSEAEGVIFETPFVLQDEVYVPVIKSGKAGRAYCLPQSILQAAPERIVPDCKHFGTCGACHFRHLSYADTLALKKRLFHAELAKMSGVEEALKGLDIVAAPDPLYYRNVARFYVEKGTLTQNTMLTHEKFALKECFVVTKKTWDTAFALLPQLPESITEIEIRENEQGEQLIILSGTQEPEINFTSHSAYFFHTEEKTFTHLYGAPTLTHYLHIEELDFAFSMGPNSFFQVHTAMAELLYSAVAREVPEEGLLYDLYAGTGTMGIIMAKLFPKLRVMSMEKNAEMVEVARLNAKQNAVESITFMQGDVQTMQLRDRPDCIIVDPPRNGLEKQSLEHLLSLGASRIIYVSCNPETFLRDAEILQEAFALTKTTIFDMTPYTSHMEVLGVFEKL